jgi:hypothetical protein
VKLSGHFVYASVSDMTDAVPLRCTNRYEQTPHMAWLVLAVEQLAHVSAATSQSMAAHTAAVHRPLL